MTNSDRQVMTFYAIFFELSCVCKEKCEYMYTYTGFGCFVLEICIQSKKQCTFHVWKLEAQ